jgi:hypothetical protein
MPIDLARTYPSALVVVMTICYNWISAPFANVDRIYFGWSFGFCLYIVVMSKGTNGKELIGRKPFEAICNASANEMK